MAELCAACGMEFATPAELVGHTQKAHGTSRPVEPEAPNLPEETGTYKCGLCGAAFSSPKRLAEHNAIPHSPAGPPQESESAST
jgi:uncharacterized C2H2 Zn-finger protein